MTITADLRGKTAFVTGASSGFGAHFARTLAMAGAKVVVGARRIGALEALVTEIGAAGGAASAVALDVVDQASISAAVAMAGDIDILINNAGVGGAKPALDVSEADWDAIIDTNLKGAWLVAVEVARGMLARGGGGSIVNIASILGLRQKNMVSPYAISKAGVIQMTKQLALELAPDQIRVNAIAPGYFPTEMTARSLDTEAGKSMVRGIPLRRLGELQDLDGPLLLLASDAGRYMTGAVLAVDGGHLVSSL